MLLKLPKLYNQCSCTTILDVCVCVCVALLSSVSVCYIISVYAFFNTSLIQSEVRTGSRIDRDLLAVITFYELNYMHSEAY